MERKSDFEGRPREDGLTAPSSAYAKFPPRRPRTRDPFTPLPSVNNSCGKSVKVPEIIRTMQIPSNSRACIFCWVRNRRGPRAKSGG